MDDLRARGAADRLRTYVELLPSAYALGEIAYDERFRSDDWPRTAYHPHRDDLLAVLGELDRLTAELHRHATCALCGHERHRHGYEPIIRRDWCGDCPTTNDLHTFQEADRG